MGIKLVKKESMEHCDSCGAVMTEYDYDRYGGLCKHCRSKESKTDESAPYIQGYVITGGTGPESGEESEREKIEISGDPEQALWDMVLKEIPADYEQHLFVNNDEFDNLIDDDDIAALKSIGLDGFKKKHGIAKITSMGYYTHPWSDTTSDRMDYRIKGVAEEPKQAEAEETPDADGFVYIKPDPKYNKASWGNRGCDFGSFTSQLHKKGDTYTGLVYVQGALREFSTDGKTGYFRDAKHQIPTDNVDYAALWKECQRIFRMNKSWMGLQPEGKDPTPEKEKAPAKHEGRVTSYFVVNQNAEEKAIEKIVATLEDAILNDQTVETTANPDGTVSIEIYGKMTPDEVARAIQLPGQLSTSYVDLAINIEG